MPGASVFAEAVLRSVAGDTGVATAPLGEALDALSARARSAWPELQLGDEAWARYLGERLDGPPSAGSLAALDGPGLYLACACVARSPAAHEALDRTLRDAALPALKKLGLAPTAIDEVLQRSRTHLLVTGDEPPRIARFAGRGTLAAWLRTVAVHLAADLRRERAPATSDLGEELLALPGGVDPELETVRADSREHFGKAFRAAVAALEPRQRTLLRLHVVERLSIDRIAPVFAASRASVARWLTEARETLAHDLRERLAAELGMRAAELDSLMTLVRSRLDLSIERVLREADR